MSDRVARDMLGALINVGDVIAYPLTAGRSANMAVYQIVEIRWGRDWRRLETGGYDETDVPIVMGRQLEASYKSIYGDNPRPSKLQFVDVRGINITKLGGWPK